MKLRMLTGSLIVLMIGTMAVILLAIVFDYSPVGPTSSVTIVGTYRYVPNPATTRPPLPGMVWAVIVKDTCYYLTVNGSWIWDHAGKSWNGCKPVEGDIVQVAGKLTERKDIWGKAFYEIEVYSLKEA